MTEADRERRAKALRAESECLRRQLLQAVERLDGFVLELRLEAEHRREGQRQ